MRIDAKILQKMLVSGANALENSKEAINNMNVFPVPDGDTGINMTLTISSVRGMDDTFATVSACSAEAASLCLRSARGNSGAIFSLFFRGLSKAWKTCDTIGVKELTEGFRMGCDQAYKAVMKPAEGTILTVMRRCAEEAEAAMERGQFSDEELIEFFEYVYAAGDEALSKTPEQLPVLKEVGVVDAGGAGFMTALSGMLAALKKNPVILMVKTESTQKADFSEFDTESITFPYCTECVTEKFPEYEGEDNAHELHELLGSIGDSVVFIEDEKIIKLHVHTDHPGLVLEKAGEYGMLVTVKIENMRNQHSALVASEEQTRQANEPKVANPENDYGFVSVCMGRGIADTFRDLGVDTVIHGGQTMNPSTQDIIDGVRRTPAKCVFVLPNNKNIYLVAVQAAKLVTDREVVVLNTKSVPQGISAMISFNPDADKDENVSEMEAAFGAVTSMSITKAVRSTSIDGVKIKNGQMLGLINGSISAVANTTFECLEMLVAHMDEPSFVTVFYGIDVTDKEARAAEAAIASLYPDAEITVINGGQPLYDFVISVE